MTVKKIEGIRTLLGFVVSIVALVSGLGMLAVDQRGAAYGAFTLAVVGVFMALAGKSSVSALAGGGGTGGAWKALTTPEKPEPKENP